jgi:putative ABC transport system permease protein
MAGNAAAQEGARPGTRFRIGKQEWLVTGISESKSFWVQGTAYGDAAQVRAATAHPDHAAFVVAQLNSPADLETFRAALRAHPEMKLDVAREDDFYNGFASRQTRGWIIVVYIVGSLISVGAGAGIFHLMQVTVEARAMEMAVLRAIGFSASAVAASVVLEAMLLGMLILWLWLDGTIYRSGLPVAVAWGRLLLAIGWSLGVALVGALSPALAAVRPEVAEALRK